MEPCLNEPLNLCTKKNSRVSKSVDLLPHRTDIDYDEALLSQLDAANELRDSSNCDKKSKVTKSTTTNGTSSSTPPSQLDGDGTTSTSFDSFIRPTVGESASVINSEASFDWQNKEKNPNLLMQQQYFLLQQQQQQQHQNQLSESFVAKTHLDKYMKLTSRYLDTMSPFFQQFTPFMGQSSASTSVQAAANAAATLLLASNMQQQQQQQQIPRKTPSPLPIDNSESNENADNSSLLNQETVRFFLHKLIEHNFLQQLQQQQQINDLINNNNNHPTNNNHSNGNGILSNNFVKEKSPSSDADSSDYFAHRLIPSPNNTKTFLDFLKNAAVAQSGMNHSMPVARNQQSFKRWFEILDAVICAIFIIYITTFNF